MNGLDFLGYALGSFIWLIIGIIALVIFIIVLIFLIAIISDILDKRKRDKEWKEFEKSKLESAKRVAELFKELNKNGTKSN